MSSFKYNILAEGPTTAKLAVVCEKPAKDEVDANRLLVGESGRRVRDHLRAAGFEPGSLATLSKNVWLTNVVQSFDEIGNPTNADIIREQPRLYTELCNLPNLNCILAMGAVALASLSNFRYTAISHYRGSRLYTAFGKKMVPTFHPAHYMRGEWRYQSVVQFDVNHAAQEAQWPEIRKTQRSFNIGPTFKEAMGWFGHLQNYPTSVSPYISFDLETVRGRNGTWYISCIAFSVDPTEAFCIPLLHKDRSPYWPEISVESQIWLKIAELLSLPNRVYVGQNLAGFDCWELRKHGILTPYMSTGFDTYSAHSLLAPDLPHKLEFITSIYTDEEYYKDESGRGETFGLVPEEQFWIYCCKDAAFTLESAIAMIKDMKEL
jgi:uracil-DNA glycosylase family 4